MGTDLQCVTLIREVKARPVLYDARRRDPQSLSEKTKAWLEIFRTLIPTWDTMPDEFKDEEGNEASFYLMIKIKKMIIFCRKNHQNQVEKYKRLLYEKL